MNIKKWIQALLVLAVVFALVACDSEVVPKGDGNPITPDKGMEVEYEVISDQGLVEEVQSWYLTSYQTEGLHVKVHEGNQYILIAAGERPSGGYQITNVSLTAVDGKIVVSGEIEGPGPDEMVTQALTYPSLLLKRVADDREFKYDGLTATQRKGALEQAGEEGIAYGTYTGMIDQNSVEIQMSGGEEEFRAFQLSDEAKEQVKNIEDGDQVSFEYEPVEGQQDRILAIKKMELTN